MTDFSLNQKDKSKGVYGKRTTLYDNHVFNVKRSDDVYKEQIQDNEAMYNQPDEFWVKNRQEKLSKNEIGIYQMLDTLQNGEVKSLPYWLKGSIESIEDGTLPFQYEGHIYPSPGRPGQFR